MEKNKYKPRNMAMPIENNKTAAWANVESLKEVSRVPMPSLMNVENAKEWVEENEK